MTKREIEILDIIFKTLLYYRLPTYHWHKICSDICHKLYDFDESFDIRKYQIFLQQENTEIE